MDYGRLVNERRVGDGNMEYGASNMEFYVPCSIFHIPFYKYLYFESLPLQTQTPPSRFDKGGVR
jgi:hypothetical protein